MLIGFDIIGDLNLEDGNTFDYEGKQTSLYCIVTGNISKSRLIAFKTLKHLSEIYQGVFFIDSGLEIGDIENRNEAISEMFKIAKLLKNVVYLHNNVAVIDGIGLLGCNGWYGNMECNTAIDDLRSGMYHHEDVTYLCKSVEKLTIHKDIKKVIVISGSVPFAELYNGEAPSNLDAVNLVQCRHWDTEGKISTWVFSGYNKMVDTIVDGVRYVNNPKIGNQPYWAKRIDV